MSYVASQQAEAAADLSDSRLYLQPDWLNLPGDVKDLITSL